MAFWKFFGLPVVRADDDEAELVDPQAELRVSRILSLICIKN